MCTFSFSSLARGNDARQLALAALCAPIHNASISPCHNFIIPIMIQFGKTQVRLIHCLYFLFGADFSELVPAENIEFPPFPVLEL